MGCHIIDPPFTALKLTSPNQVWVEGPGCTDDMHPAWEIIHYEFPGTEFTAGKTLTLTWYDGHHRPDESLVPLGKGQHLPDSGSIFIGEKGSILLPHVGGPQLLPREKFLDYKRPKLPGRNHYVQWVNACLGKDKASANFDFAGPLDRDGPAGRVGGTLPRQEAAVGCSQSQGHESARGQPARAIDLSPGLGSRRAVGNALRGVPLRGRMPSTRNATEGFPYRASQDRARWLRDRG